MGDVKESGRIAARAPVRCRWGKFVLVRTRICLYSDLHRRVLQETGPNLAGFCIRSVVQ